MITEEDVSQKTKRMPLQSPPLAMPSVWKLKDKEQNKTSYCGNVYQNLNTFKFTFPFIMTNLFYS